MPRSADGLEKLEKVRNRSRRDTALLTTDFFKNNVIYLFISDCAGSSLLSTGFFCSCKEQRLLVSLQVLLIVVASFVGKHRL